MSRRQAGWTSSLDVRTFEERAVKLHREGLADSKIASRLAYLIGSERTVRERLLELYQRLGLKANDPFERLSVRR